MVATALLEASRLAIQAGGRTLIQDLNLALYPGQCWGVLGMNGTGKTTLLHTLAGLQSAAQGHVQLNGQSLNALSRREIAQQLGLLLQEFHELFPGTVMETALIGRHPHLNAWEWESADDQKQAEAALAAVDLDGFVQRQVNTLSGGERRRLGIATTLLQDPQVMLLDEPVNHLDLHHQHNILALINNKVKNENKTAMMVLHDINLAARYCDHVLLIYKDGETRLGKTKELLQAEILSELYQHNIQVVEHQNGVFFIPV